MPAASNVATLVILIPAYEPDQRLIDLVGSIRRFARDQTIVVVDDGSGAAYADVFTAAGDLGCDVLVHPVNRGKGVALKAGFAHIAARFPGSDVICADCDGQHSIIDILKVAEALCTGSSRSARGIALGARQFAGDVPARSRFGNTMTRVLFAASTGLRLQDTQTGLRGYPADLLPWLCGVDGDRFEYELNVLLAARAKGLDFVEVPIATIYLEGNESSHFRPVRDSIRVYVPLLTFSVSSLAAFAIDAAVFLAMMAVTGHLLTSVVVARLISASINFVTNRRLVFAGSTRHPLVAASRYAAVVGVVMAANYALIGLFGRVGVPLVAAKLLTELTLFTASYQLQRRFVFTR